jgi:hypothetical protein
MPSSIFFSACVDCVRFRVRPVDRSLIAFPAQTLHDFAPYCCLQATRSQMKEPHPRGGTYGR